MSLTVDGRATLKAMLDAEQVFSGIPARDWAAAAVKLARRQIIVGKQTREDILAIRKTLGEDVFEKALDTLTAYQALLLVKRVDPGLDDEWVNTCATALAHIRKVLKPEWTVGEPASTDNEAIAQDTTAPAEAEPEKKANPYIGRRAFRTGR